MVITIVVPDGGVAAVGERAGAPVADARGVVGVPAEDPCLDPARIITSIATDFPHHQREKQKLNRGERRGNLRRKAVLCHEAAVVVADAVPYHVVAHLRRRCLELARPIHARAGLCCLAAVAGRPARNWMLPKVESEKCVLAGQGGATRRMGAGG